MITAKLVGGLGNQMFQIATTYAYAKRHGFDYGFNFDSCSTPNQGKMSSEYKNNLFKNINNIDNNVFNKTYKETTFSYIEIPKNDNLILDGYFQSEKYFSDYKDEIIKLFQFPAEIVVDVLNFMSKEFPIDKRPITSIHVRRGDYLKYSNFHRNLSETEYYNNAMNLIEGNFIIISDDINWCKENFKGYNIYYSPFKDELEDLYLMMCCNNQIIANSSFSWWGAYLSNKSENKKVIAPKMWFGNDGHKDVEDIIPNNWIKI